MELNRLTIILQLFGGAFSRTINKTSYQTNIAGQRVPTAMTIYDADVENGLLLLIDAGERMPHVSVLEKAS